MTWPPHNPYEAGYPVSSDRSFANRERERRELHEVAAAPEHCHVVVYGPRRIGKTSLLKRFEAELDRRATPPTEAVSAFVFMHDLRDEAPPPSTPEDVAMSLLNFLAQKLAERLQVSCAEPAKTPQDFRRRVLPQLIEAANHRRLIVVLDEIQALDALASERGKAIRFVFDAFGLEGPGRPPLLVACWSLGLGEVFSEPLERWLPRVTNIEVRCFDRDAIKCLTELAGAYSWSDEAIDWLMTQTGGHPLYASGINRVIWRQRRAAERTEPVTRVEVMEVVDDAIRVVESSLMSAWEQLNSVQSCFGRALAALTHGADNPARAGLPVGVTMDEVKGRLHADGYAFETVLLRSSLHGLIENGVIHVSSFGGEAERYRLTAPFLGRWLAGQEYANLTRNDFRKHIDTARHYYEHGQEVLAREHLIEAEKSDPIGNPLPIDDLAILAELERNAGLLGDALEHYRKLWARDPGRGNAALCEALVQQILRPLLRGMTLPQHGTSFAGWIVSGNGLTVPMLRYHWLKLV